MKLHRRELKFLGLNKKDTPEEETIVTKRILNSRDRMEKNLFPALEIYIMNFLR